MVSAVQELPSTPYFMLVDAVVGLITAVPFCNLRAARITGSPHPPPHMQTPGVLTK